MSNVYDLNRKTLIDMMETGSVLLLDSGKPAHKTADEFYFFKPNKNFYYLTGIQAPECRLMIVKGDKESKTYLFIKETTEFMRKWVGESISKEDVNEISGINILDIHYNKQFPSVFATLMDYTRGSSIGVPNNLYVDSFIPTPGEQPIAFIQYSTIIDTYKELNIKDINKFLSYQRMFKSDYEVVNLKQAIAITNLGLNRVMKELENRSNEAQINADFNHELALNGTKYLGFSSIFASGKNATILHYEDNDASIDPTTLLLCDLGAEYNEYSADISRTYPANGKFNKRQKEIYEIVLKANKETIAFLKPGVTWKEFNEFAKNILITECKKIGLIEEDAEINNYYYHSIGHFLGLNTHDMGHYNLPLKEGMVVTVEPGLYIKEEGLGVRIEDDILITKNGSINLSIDIIKEVNDIETFMSQK